jgi:hypothetical protein
MPELAMDRAKRIYREAIDLRAKDAEGDQWWEAVRAELAQVLSARARGEAAAVIAWWHHDWSYVSYPARDAARRIRAAAGH